MATLEHVPNEIAREIMMRVGNESIKDLASLSVVNRRFHEMADMETRKAFHKVTVTGQRYDVERLASIVEEISKRKILGTYVQVVEVLDTCKDGAHSIPEFEFYNQDILDFLAAKDLDSDSEEGEGREKTENAPLSEATLLGAMAATLFSLCPNINKLVIPRVPLGLWMVIGSIPYEDLYTLPPMLRGLRRVEFSHLEHRRCVRSVYQPVDMRHALLILSKFSTIECMRFEGISTRQDQDHVLSPRQSDLKKLHINHSFVDSAILTEALRHLKALEEFSYSCDGLYTFSPSPIQVHPDRLRGALYAHKSTLRVLDLDLRLGLIPLIVHAHATRAKLSNSRLGSLAEFTALTHLSVDINCLLLYKPGERARRGSPILRLVDMLPRHLEYLCIREYMPGRNKLHDTNIEEFQNKRFELFPNLHEVFGIAEYIPGVQRVEFPDMPLDANLQH